MARRKSKIFISNVDGFAALPLDLLCEIFSRLHPIDLLHLARTNKAIRAFVLNRSNAMIWKAAYANNALAGGPPGCPSYMSEPAWARVAFDKSCVGCQVTVRDDPSCDPIWWEFGGRMCNTCLDSATRGGISAKLRKLVSKVDWENVLLRVKKDGSFESNPYGRTPSSRSWFYLAAQQDELLAQLSPLSDKERRQLIEQRTQETAAINAV
uniref:F-box domain-containing protein n=1 Tax=Mycena chlorophos TaxID=658473 RepID=A0ABQ0L8W7_MYCCL|nr:predicted protein [Mycena chlorophos]